LKKCNYGETKYDFKPQKISILFFPTYSELFAVGDNKELDLWNLKIKRRKRTLFFSP